jgi:drug/metabolite transporter (DMT)-like permease
MIDNCDGCNKERSATAQAILLLPVAPLCWAGNIVLARGVIDIMPPVALAFWRWAVAFLVLLPFAWRQTRRDWPAAVRHWKILLVLSFLGISCFNTLLYTAMHTTTAINGALIQTTMPAIIILITLLFFNERVTLLQMAGVMLCVVGAGTVVLQGQWHLLTQMALVRGDILMSIAVVVYALYSALLRKRPAMHPVSFLVYTFGIGALGLLPLYLVEIGQGHTFTPAWETLASILYVALFPSIVAYFCWNRGVELIGANRTGLFINLIPVFASLMAIAWLGESLERFHMVGMLLILTGMVMFNRRRR